MVLALRDWLWVGLLVLADQVTKWLALAARPANSLFEFTWNTGAGFGIFPGKNIVLLLVSLVVLALIWKPLVESRGHEHVAYLMLMSGILGNSIDRLVHGAVIDFISVGSFPIFNVADSLISVSIAYLVAVGLRESFSSWNFRRKEKKLRRAEAKRSRT